MSASSSFTSGDPPVRLLVAFQQAYPEQTPERLVRAPGRDVWVAAARAASEHFTVTSPDHEARATFSLRSARLRRTVTQRPLPRWARYPAGVILTLGSGGLDIPGLNTVVLSGEPPGPAYEFGLGMAFAALGYEIHAQPYTSDMLIDVVDRARREYVEA
ncbi:MAG: hypothetical protein HXY41_16485 [Chloroflexi bacterium]|nr:hypothetical protein [Chloroflexota bacterium]